MNVQELTKYLQHPKPSVRLMSIHTLKMVDEVRALDAISERVPMEMDTKVEQELKATGRYLNKLKRDGYDTVQAICEYFNVYSEVLTFADEEEFKEIHRMVLLTTDKRKDDDTNDKVINNASMLIASRTIGASTVMGVKSAVLDLSSNVGSVAEAMQKQKKRVRPSIPTQKDISRWVKLIKSDNASDRQEAIVQLNSAKNPAGLQYMAYAHANDESERVRETAKRVGRMLYWNSVYYAMEQDGTIKQIMDDFAESLGIVLPDDVTSTQEIPMPPAADEDIADILARADKLRKKRGQRR